MTILMEEQKKRSSAAFTATFGVPPPGPGVPGALRRERRPPTHGAAESSPPGEAPPPETAGASGALHVFIGSDGAAHALTRRSLCCLGPEHPLRRACVAIATHRFFDRAVLALILYSSALMAVTDWGHIHTEPGPFVGLPKAAGSLRNTVRRVGDSHFLTVTLFVRTGGARGGRSHQRAPPRADATSPISVPQPARRSLRAVACSPRHALIVRGTC